MTDFVQDHPGGADIILANRSRDVSRLFVPRHPKDQLDDANLPEEVRRVGILDPLASEAELADIALQISQDQLDEEDRIRSEREKMEERGLGAIVNMRDFEKFAEPLLSRLAWAYYASAGDDEISEWNYGSTDGS